MEKSQKITDRLVEIVKNVGGNEAAARITGKSVKSIERYKAGKEGSFESYAALAKAAGISLNWLATGEGQMHGFEDKGSTDYRHGWVVTSVHGGQQGIPLIDVAASAGGGSLVLEEAQRGVIAFDPAWLRMQWNVNPNDLFSMSVTGESMEPGIKPGELLLCSRSADYIKPGDGIYVVRLDDNILVKRLQLLPGGRIKVSSDNPAYQPYEITPSEGTDFTILGKVVLVHGLRRV